MAIIKSLKKEKFTASMNSQSNTYGRYSLQFDEQKNKYVVIKTYGSEDRTIPNKQSQNIAISKKMAMELIDIFKLEFNL